MDNPVGLCFTPGGEMIVSGTFFQHPAGGHRDGLIHAVYGGVYGKDHDVVYEHPWTSPHLMPIMTHLGPAAPSGLIRYESTSFGPEYKDNLFCALFNLHKVTRHVLIPTGATFRTEDEDFVVSNNVDFHPTDVIEDADGSLLIIDTGGWYKLCCPTSQFHKPDVLGAIYRVQPTGRAGRGAERRGPPSDRWASSLRSSTHPTLTDPDETIRQRAIHSAGLNRDRSAIPGLLPLLAGPSMQNRRAAAEALGRIGDKAAVPALLALLATPADRVLEHSLTYALIEIGDRQSVAAGLKSDNPRVRRAALTALDQMPGGMIEPESFIRELTADDPALKETAWWIAGRHPEWGEQLVATLRERITAKMTPAETEDLTNNLAKLAKSPAIQDFLAFRLTMPSGRAIALRAMARANLHPPPIGWSIKLVNLLLSIDTVEELQQAISTVRALNVPKANAIALAEVLTKLAARNSLPTQLRLDAIAAARSSLWSLDSQSFVFVRGQLQADRPIAARTTAAEILSNSKLSTSQLLSLCDAVKTAGPLEVERLLDAFAESNDEAVGLALVSALKANTSGGLRVAALRPRLAKFGPAVQKPAEELYAVLNANEAEQKTKLEQLLSTIGNGDVRRGQSVFHSQKAACYTCHAVGYVGGKLGPDLTKIGSIRTERDLLESIIFPSASFVRSYEPVVVTTKSGKSHNGLLRKDAADEVVVATGADQEVRVPRADVDEVQPSTVSVMPAGLDQQLSKQELADLIEFLKACK
jgi:putative heme-binding domain-containing protein